MSSNDAVSDFKAYIKGVEEEISKLKNEALNEETCSTPPQLHSEDSLDVLHHNKLKLECEIESIVNSDQKFLPEDEAILLNLAKENAQDTVSKTSQALEFQIKLNENLKEEKTKLRHFIQNTEAVESKLNDLIENRSDEDYIASLNYKYNNHGKIFQELRQALHWYLNSRFPTDDVTSLGMEDILEKLTKQFLTDANDPYVDFEGKAKEEHVTTLIKANLVFRHPKDPLKFRLLDYRRN